MRLDSPLDGECGVGFFKSVVAEIPKAVAQVLSAGKERLSGDIEKFLDPRGIVLPRFFRRINLEGNTCKRLRKRVMDLYCEPCAFGNAKLGAVAGDSFP